MAATRALKSRSPHDLNEMSVHGTRVACKGLRPAWPRCWWTPDAVDTPACERIVNRTHTVSCIALVAFGCADATTRPTATSPSLAQQTGGEQHPVAVFDDTPTYKVRSDGFGAYVDGTPWNFEPPHCVISDLGASGFYMLRTSRNSTSCQDFASYDERRFIFDLGAPLEDLDGDSVIEALEEASGRFLVDKATGKTSSPLLILTGPGPLWEIRYQKNIVTRNDAGGARILEAIPGDAAADLYQRVQVRGRLVSQFRRTVQLPFKLTLSP